MRYFRQIALAAICSVALFAGPAFAQTAQTITFGSPPSLTYGDASPFSFSVQASSNLAFDSTGASGACSLASYNGNGAAGAVTVNIVSGGNCTISAAKNAGSGYSAATNSISFAIARKAQSITFGAPILNNKIVFNAVPPPLTATADSGLTVSFSSLTTGQCTVSGTAITLVSVGNCTIRAAQAGDARYLPAGNIDQTFAIEKGSALITFPSPADTASNLTPPTPSAVSTNTVTPLTYTSTTLPVCTVTSGGALTFVVPGTCTLKASQAASANFSAPPDETASFTVLNGLNLITFQALTNTPINLPPPALTASANSGLPVSFASTTGSTCSVNSDGSGFTLLAVGDCSITASQAGNGTVGAAIPVTKKFNVTAAVNVITFPDLPASSLSNGAPTLAATSTAGTVVYTSETTPVCTVSGSTITLVKVGSCSIKASVGPTGIYAEATPVTRTFQVSAKSQALTFDQPSDTQFTSPPPVLSASTNALPAASYPISFSSSTATVCTVTTTGTITFKAAGVCSIAAAQNGDNDNYAAATPITRSFNVTQGVNTITFADPISADIAFGNPPPSLGAKASSKLAVTYAVAPASAAVCKVTPAGAITILAAGTCTITASQGGNANYVPAVDVQASFVVTPAPASSISFAQPADVSIIGPPPALVASSTAGPVTFTSKTPNVCGASASTGQTSLLKVGLCTITVSDAVPSSVTRSFNITAAPTNVITFPLPPNTPFNSVPPTLAATAKSTPPMALQVTYASNSPAVCTVTNGVLTFVAGGACSITASQSGDIANGIPAAASVTRQFTVTPGANVITFPQPDPAPFTGTPPTLGATASSGLAVTYASNSLGICKVTSAGVITFVAGGSCSITAAQAGNASWKAAAKVTRTFAVQTGNNIITFNKPDDTPFTSTPPTVKPTASSGLTVSLTSDTPLVCTVTSPGGVIKFLKGGDCSITAKQPGNATYKVATPVTRIFAVLPGVNVITFPALAAVTLNGIPTTPAASASSGLPVSYTSKTPDLCTVSSGGQITLLQNTAVTLPSPCTITASQAGNVSYAVAADVDQTFTVELNPTATGGASTGSSNTVSPQLFSPFLALEAPQQDTSETTLVTTDQSPLLGEPITLTATVTPSPVPAGGTVTFHDGGITVCDSVPLDIALEATATCTIAYSTSGPHDMTATFGGNNAFAEFDLHSAHHRRARPAAMDARYPGSVPRPAERSDCRQRPRSIA